MNTQVRNNLYWRKYLFDKCIAYSDMVFAAKQVNINITHIHYLFHLFRVSREGTGISPGCLSFEFLRFVLSLVLEWGGGLKKRQTTGGGDFCIKRGMVDVS